MIADIAVYTVIILMWLLIHVILIAAALNILKYKWSPLSIILSIFVIICLLFTIRTDIILIDIAWDIHAMNDITE